MANKKKRKQKKKTINYVPTFTWVAEFHKKIENTNTVVNGDIFTIFEMISLAAPHQKKKENSRNKRKYTKWKQTEKSVVKIQLRKLIHWWKNVEKNKNTVFVRSHSWSFKS